MKNRICIIVSVLFVAVVVVCGLVFMGVINPDNNESSVVNESTTDDEWEVTDSDLGETTIEANTSEENIDWQIIYGGMEITPNIECDAIINSNNTLCFYVDDMWNIEVVMYDVSYEEYSSNIEEREASLQSKGFIIEEKATKVNVGEKEYIYIAISGEITLGDGTKEEKYMTIISTDSGDGRRYEAIVDINNVVKDNISALDMTKEERNTIYEESVFLVDSLIGDARITDKENHPIGTAWYAESGIAGENVDNEKEFLNGDSLFDMEGNTIVTYELPEDTYLSYSPVSTEKISEKWYSTKDGLKIYIFADSSGLYENALEYATFGADTGDKKINEIVETKIDGRTWYYYTYNTAMVSKEDTILTYFFVALTDLEDGTILKIYATSNSPYTWELETYNKILYSIEP